MKKAIFLLLVLTGIVPVACCPEPPSGPYLLHFGSVYLFDEGYVAKHPEAHRDYILSPNDSYIQDTLVLEFVFGYSFARNYFDFEFYSAAMALSCDDDPRFTHLNDKIADITIMSNMPFNEVEPGQPLNTNVRALDREINSLIPLRQAIDLINSINGYETMDRQLNTLAITEKPAGAYQHTFSVMIRYESGREERMESIPLTW